jgi:hypothetical protein
MDKRDFDSDDYTLIDSRPSFVMKSRQTERKKERKKERKETFNLVVDLSIFFSTMDMAVYD